MSDILYTDEVSQFEMCTENKPSPQNLQELQLLLRDHCLKME